MLASDGTQGTIRSVNNTFTFQPIFLAKRAFVVPIHNQFRQGGPAYKSISGNSPLVENGEATKMTNTGFSSKFTDKNANGYPELSPYCREIGIRAVAAAVRYQRMPACDEVSERQGEAKSMPIGQT